MQQRGHRYYNSQLGRWQSRDPIEEEGCINVYSFALNASINGFDAFGLWGTAIHRDKTKDWAVALAMPLPGAEKIADEDERVDSDFTSFTFSEGNWSWHFDRSNGGLDTRLRHTIDEYIEAKKSCTWTPGGQDNWKAAAKSMGRALHPLQDWVAHGDFNRRREAPYIASVPWFRKSMYAHNQLTTQAGRGWGTVDDAWYDSTGPNGRATIGVLNFATITPYGDRLFWATFNPGPRRRVLTEQKTKELLQWFTNYVREKGKPCGECQSAFLGTP